MINFDEFDIEETSHDVVNIGDRITISGRVMYYAGKSRLYKYYTKGSFTISDKKLGKDIRSNLRGDIYEHGIDCDSYLYMFSGHWPWFDLYCCDAQIISDVIDIGDRIRIKGPVISHYDDGNSVYFNVNRVFRVENKKRVSDRCLYKLDGYSDDVWIDINKAKITKLK